MLKIKDNVDLKELEKYDFVKLENDYRGHKYSWKRYLENWIDYYEIYIAKDNRVSIYVESPNGMRYLRIRNKLQDKLYDLIKDGLVEKVDDK